MDTEVTQTTESTASEAPESLSVKEAAAEAFDELVSSSEPEVEAASETDSRPEEQKTAKEEASFNRDSLDPIVRKEFDTIEKRWKDTQASLMRREQQYKAHEEKLSKFEEFQQAKQQLDYFSRIYDSNPEVKAILNKALGVKSNDVDPDLMQDPLYQYIQQAEQKREEQIRPLVEWYQKSQTEQRDAELNAQVDQAEKGATSKFQEMMGREPTQQETAKILKHMVEKRVYDGEAAAVAVFLNEILAQKTQSALSDQMKKKTVGTRVSSVNSAKAQGDKYKSMSVKDILRENLEEMGF